MDEADARRQFERDAVVRGDFVERFVNVREMVFGDVADELAIDFVVAHAAMEPAQEDGELHAGGGEGGE